MCFLEILTTCCISFQDVCVSMRYSIDGHNLGATHVSRIRIRNSKDYYSMIKHPILTVKVDVIAGRGVALKIRVVLLGKKKKSSHTTFLLD